MNVTQDSTSPKLSPPVGFLTLEEVLGLPHSSIKGKNLFINVIGFIKDYQPPVPSRGTDWKCTLGIMDPSIQDTSCDEVKVSIFWKKGNMPVISNKEALDAVIIRQVKVQVYNGSTSLIANHNTQFYILGAADSPRTPADAATASAKWLSYPRVRVVPKVDETTYVIKARHQISTIGSLEPEEYQQVVVQAMGCREKFGLLKDVKPDEFHDILGEVVKVYDGGNPLTMHFTDYTANSSFFNHFSEGTNEGPCDEFGIPKPESRVAKENEWTGPPGKLTIQLSFWDDQADCIRRDSIKPGQWVLISNVQFKHGRNGGCLEGFVRNDLRTPEKILVKKIERNLEEDTVNGPRYKEAVERKWKWKQKTEAQMKAPKESAGLGDDRKRKDEDDEPQNSKARRKQKRAEAEKAALQAEKRLASKLDLNPNIICNNPTLDPVPLFQILKPEVLRFVNQEVQSPFTVRQYRANIRVVDYFPPRIEDFAVGYRESEFDLLSDYTGSEDTDREEDMKSFRSGKGVRKNIWEWRFSLQVEDAEARKASAKGENKQRVWLVVNNSDAQMLLGLDEDATNLRSDPELLSKLKEQLFKLWGDLEERKSATLPPTQPQNTNPSSSFSTNASPSPPRQRAGEMPEDSESENEAPPRKTSSVLQERDANLQRNINDMENAELKVGETDQENKSSVPKNKAFTCCIKQYGIKVPEKDPTKANAKEGKRYQRMFGLFGTTIK